MKGCYRHEPTPYESRTGIVPQKYSNYDRSFTMKAFYFGGIFARQPTKEAS
ncbi:MAG: hypothetical protein FWC08_13640 [Defluviitaleaceae bacterium]|nr:hypothetical protein [Defluviitaleaceae bacterium]